MLNGKEKAGAGFVLDVALGMLCADDGGHDDWAVRARDARRRADMSWLRNDVESCRSLLVESVLCDGLAHVDAGDAILSDALALLSSFDDDGWCVESAWCCPECSDPFGDDEVRLSYVGHGDYVCPRCGRHTLSPADDGAWLASGSSWCVSAVSDARGLDGSGLLDRSAFEWTAVEDAYESGDYDGVLRHSVMAELLDCVMLGRPVSEWPDRVATMVEDTVEFYKGTRRVCSLCVGSSCSECVLSGLAHMGGDLS